MTETYHHIGIIAGKGIYPKEFIAAARANSPDTPLSMIAVKGETDPMLAELVDKTEWIRIGQFEKLLRFLKNRAVREVVMVGQITPKNLYDLRPDLKTIALLAKLKERNAETIFGAITDELSKVGITVIPATTFLEKQIPHEGHVAGPTLKEKSREDARFGFYMAKQMSALDIGQSVLVREGTVLAVEAFEGSNDCIRRGASLGKKKNVVFAKVSKPNQNVRFDVPVIGPDTIRICSKEGVRIIVIEADSTLILGFAEVQCLCSDLGITLHALKTNSLSPSE